MAYTEFSTANADYIFELTNHVSPRRKEGLFKGVDILIAETGECSLEYFLNHSSAWGNEKIINFCKNENIPVFSAEIFPMIDFFGGLGRPGSLPYFLAYYAVGIYHGFSKEKCGKILLNFHTYASKIAKEPCVEGRNAIHARKIGEFIVDYTAEKIGKRPRIGLMYGAAHTGLKDDLIYKERRNFSIKYWMEQCRKKGEVFELKQLNSICEGNYSGGSWKTSQHLPDLF